MTRVHIPTMLMGLMLTAAHVRAQPSAQQMPTQQGASGMPSQELVTACVDAQQQVSALAAQVNSRLEDARQTNSPQQMRAALADLQAALVEIRTRAAQCSPLMAAAQPATPMAGMDPSKMPMGGTAPTASPGAKAPAKPGPMTGMDSTMPMGGAASRAKPGAKAPAKPADPMAGMDSKMPMGGAAPKAKPGAKAPAKSGAEPGAVSRGEAKLPVTMAERVADPSCPDNVGRADAPRATYQRKVYYFCSTADRDAFKKDPAAYLKRRPR